MNETIFKTAIIAAALAFLAVVALVVMPPLIAEPDVIGAFTAGFALYLLMRMRQAGVVQEAD